MQYYCKGGGSWVLVGCSSKAMGPRALPPSLPLQDEVHRTGAAPPTGLVSHEEGIVGNIILVGPHNTTP